MKYAPQQNNSLALKLESSLINYENIKQKALNLYHSFQEDVSLYLETLGSLNSLESLMIYRNGKQGRKTKAQQSGKWKVRKGKNSKNNKQNKTSSF